MKLPIALATLALLGVAPQPGREIPARTWLHWIGETPDLEDLRGRTVLLHFMSTNPDPKIQAKAHWPVVQKHHHEFADKGVVFIGLCRESAASVRTYMGEHIIPFPVGCGADEAWSEFGVASEFHEILIDKDGEVAWRGPANGLWNGKLLKTAKGSERLGVHGPLVLHVDAPKSLRKATGYLEEGKLGKALAALGSILASKNTDDELRGEAEALQTAIGAHVEALLEQCAAALENGEALPAFETLETLDEELAKHAFGQAVTDALAEARQDPANLDELEAARTYEDILDAYYRRGLKKNAARLEKLVDAYPETWTADKARILLARL